MFIEPFWCGVVATLVIEVVALFIYGLYLGNSDIDEDDF